MILGKIKDSYLLDKFKKLTLWKTVRLIIYVLIVAHFLLLLFTSLKIGRWTISAVNAGDLRSKIPRGTLVLNHTEIAYMPKDIVFFEAGDVNTVSLGEVNGISLTESGLKYQIQPGQNAKAVNVDEKQVISRVVYRLPVLGWLVTFDRTPLGLFIFALVFGLFLYGDLSGKLKIKVEQFQNKVKENKAKENRK